jgi:sugar lactone lactonase YvrE
MKTKQSHKHAGKIAGFVLWLALLPLAALGQSNYATPYTFTTFAGNNGFGSADGTNSAARFAYDDGVAVDSAGNIYVADVENDTIRMVTPAGVVTTIAGLAGSPGSADGTNSAARFNDPVAVAVDHAGNVFVADYNNDTIREMTLVGTNWVVTTIAGLAGVSGSANGTGSAARFKNPTDVGVDTNSNVYVADYANDTIRKLTPSGTNWAVATIAGVAGGPGNGDGTGSVARFNYPAAVAADRAGNLYVTDSGNNTIRMITPAGKVTTIAGLAGSSGSTDGTNSTARFSSPGGLDVDSSGNLYVADYNNDTIREVSPVGTNWVVSTLAGLAGSPGSADGTNSAARFNGPDDVAVDSAGNLHVADSVNSTIRQMTPVGTNWVVTTLAGLATGGPGSADGMTSAARFSSPIGVSVDSAGNLYVADYGNDTIRQVTPAGMATTLAGLAGVSGTNNGTGSAARFNNPADVAVDSTGNLYVADWASHTIRQMTPVGTNWVVTTIAGTPGVSGFVSGLGTTAKFDYPNGLAVDASNNVYVADTGNAAVRKVALVGTNWFVTTVSTSFSGPTGVAVGPDGNIYVADYYSHTIRKMTPAGVVTVIAGSGTAGSADGPGSIARFNYPQYLAVDSATNVYVGDVGNSAIRKVSPTGTSSWAVTTLAGVAVNLGYMDGTGHAAQFDYGAGVAVDSTGALYVADEGNSTIRKGWLATSVPPPNLQPPSLNAGQFGFGITGLSGLAVNIESSTDLSQWQLAGTVTLVGGTNYFVSPNPPSGTQFYRGHLR